MKASTFRTGMHLIRRARCREDTSMPLQIISGNDVVKLVETLTASNALKLNFSDLCHRF